VGRGKRRGQSIIMAMDGGGRPKVALCERDRTDTLVAVGLGVALCQSGGTTGVVAVGIGVALVQSDGTTGSCKSSSQGNTLGESGCECEDGLQSRSCSRWCANSNCGVTALLGWSHGR
jgi:hypothetical protein